MAKMRVGGPLKTIRAGAAWRTLFSVCCLAGATASSAATMRCNGDLISDGKMPRTTDAEILYRCGEPYSKSGRNWLYVRGKNQVYRLQFDANGELTRIVTEIVR